MSQYYCLTKNMHYYIINSVNMLKKNIQLPDKLTIHSIRQRRRRQLAMWSVLFGMSNLYKFPCGIEYYFDGNDMERCGDVDDSHCSNNDYCNKYKQCN